MASESSLVVDRSATTVADVATSIDRFRFRPELAADDVARGSVRAVKVGPAAVEDRPEHVAVAAAEPPRSPVRVSTALDYDDPLQGAPAFST
jgi:hypothetical protein